MIVSHRKPEGSSLTRRGDALSPADQAWLLSLHSGRLTETNRKAWGRWRSLNGREFMPKFRDDAEWLAHCEFYVDIDGRVDKTTVFYIEHPTWPMGKLSA